MLKLTLWRLLPILLLSSLVVAACSDLAGDVEIVATVQPTSVAQAQPTAIELPTNPPNIANGELIFQQNCTSCHGVTGAGDGDLVESGEVPRMGSFRDRAHVRQQSVEFYYDIITNGNIINLMPPWSQALSLQERWDVTMYVYTLQYGDDIIAQGEALVDTPNTGIQLASDNDLAIQSELTGDDAYAAIAYERMQSVVTELGESSATVDLPETVNFSGTITQGSPNATLPREVNVQLQYGDFTTQPEVLRTQMDTNGQFSFSDVPVADGYQYFAIAYYNGRPFLADPILASNLQPQNVADITLYETSNAPNIVTQTDMELVLDFFTVPDLGPGIVTSQTSVYENPTQYVFHLEPEGQDIRVSLLVSIPIGAVILDAPDRPEFIPVQDQFALIDTRPVYPGRHVAETTYFIPYEDSAKTVDIAFNNRFMGELNVVVTDPELRIISDVLTFSETVNVGTAEQPINAQLYTGMVDFQAGDNFIFDIEGRVSQNTSDNSSILTQDELIPIFAGALVVIILVAGGVIFYLRSNRNDTQREIDRLMIEIARLEKMHDSGQINHDAFQQKRAELRQQLAELTGEGQAQ